MPLEKILLVGNKVDVGRNYNELDAAISCKTHEGYDDFTKLLTDRVSKLYDLTPGKYNNDDVFHPCRPSLNQL